MNLKSLIKRKSAELKHVKAKNRDRVRHRLQVLKVAQQLRKECSC